MSVEKISISGVIIYLIIYIVLHSIIGYLKKRFEENPNPDISENDITINKNILNFLFNWFPAIYVIFLIISFYMG